MVLNPLFQAAIYYFLYTVLRNSPQSKLFLPILIANFFFFGLSMARALRRRDLDPARPRASCSTRRSRGRCCR